MSLRPVLPPATLGVLGGGQLGRYLVMAARTMGYRTMVLEPDPAAPAGRVADVHLVAAYDDADALARVAAECDVVTTEFENPPAAALDLLGRHALVRPGAHAIAIAQDRRAEKHFLTEHGFPTAPFAVVESAADLATIEVGVPAIVKTARLGYDGKGQVSVADRSELATAWRQLGEVPCVVEQRLVLERELSVVIARSTHAETAAFAVTENVHVGGILDVSIAPAGGELADAATELAVAVAGALDYVGVLGVELFVVDGRLVVNELAPRPHNSGHWTLDAARTSQFEQQVRAVCGLPLGDPTMTAPAVAMVNLLGDLWDAGTPDWSAMLADAQAHLHLYGKHEARPGRKMGHLTVTAATTGAAAAAAVASRSHGRRNLQLGH
jgi:5-(carboxyamino)imidazole ribonucleotide synthase